MTATGEDDDFADGTQNHSVVVSVDSAGSNIEFPPIPQLVSVSTRDDEASEIVLDRSSAVVHETGTQESLQVSLAGAPLSPVVLNVVSVDPGEVTVDRSSLTFNSSNWNIPQSIAITGVNDRIEDGDQTSSIEITVDQSASHDHFHDAELQTVTVTTVDSIVVRNEFSLDIDGNGATESLTDGLLLLRYLSGFTLSLIHI